MEIYQLQVFLAVAQSLSFTEAAEALNLTQPAVSAKIKSLEAELNTPLFHRLGRKVELTEVGKFLAEEGGKLVELEAQIRQRVEDFKKGNAGTLKIGASPAIAETWLPQLIYEYRQRYPGVQTRSMVFESSDSLYKAITSKSIDLGFSELQFEAFTEIINCPIDRVQYFLVVSKTHPLAKRKWLSVKQLMHAPWVLLSENFASRLVFESRLAELGVNLKDFSQVETVNTLGLMRTYLTQGHYVGFISDLELKEEREYGVLSSIMLQEFALESDLFLLLPKQYEKLLFSKKRTKTSPKSSDPVQSFLGLLSSGNQNDLQVSCLRKAEHPTMRSPTFWVRANSCRKQETIRVNVGIQNGTIPTVTAGLIPQQLGIFEHFLPRTGRYSSTHFNIQWCNFPMGTPIVEGLHNDELDIGILGDYPLLQSAKNATNPSQGCKTILASFISINPEGTGNAILVPQQSQIKSMEDLRGQTVALPLGSSAHGMVLRALHTLNLLSDIELHPIRDSLPEKLDLENQRVAGYAHFSPFHELAHFQAKFRYLFQGNLSGLPGFYGVVIRQAFAEKYPEIVISYLKAIAAAQYWYTTTPHALSLISQWTQISPKILGQIISSSYQKERSNLFFPNLNIRPDWIQSHIDQLHSIPNHQHLETINLDAWIQSEFLETALATN